MENPQFHKRKWIEDDDDPYQDWIPFEQIAEEEFIPVSSIVRPSKIAPSSNPNLPELGSQAILSQTHFFVPESQLTKNYQETNLVVDNAEFPTFGLPTIVRDLYYSKGVKRLYDWQIQCLTGEMAEVIN
jgi:hypothetical protein